MRPVGCDGEAEGAVVGRLRGVVVGRLRGVEVRLRVVVGRCSGEAEGCGQG